MSQTPQPPLGGRYELRRQLAATPAARVYLAQDLELGRPVAVKVLGPDLARDPGDRRQVPPGRQRRPPRSTTRTSSPSTTRARTRARSTSRWSTSTARASPRRCRRSGRLGVAPTINMGIRVAEALDAAHSAGPGPRQPEAARRPARSRRHREGHRLRHRDRGPRLARGPGRHRDLRRARAAAGPGARRALGSLLARRPPVRVDHRRPRRSPGPDAVAITQRKLSERGDPTVGRRPRASRRGSTRSSSRLLERDPARRYIERWRRRGRPHPAGRDRADPARRADARAMPTAVAPAPVAAAPPPSPPPEEKKRSATGWIVAAIIVLVLAVGGLSPGPSPRTTTTRPSWSEVPAVVGARAADARPRP